jgi:hypothetical protein
MVHDEDGDYSHPTHPGSSSAVWSWLHMSLSELVFRHPSTPAKYRGVSLYKAKNLCALSLASAGP